MANIMALLKPTAQLSKNGFDLSQKHVFSLAPGRLDCPLFVETVPNDNFKIDLGSIMRTMTLHTASFLRGKMVFDFFFVPYAQTWHNFNQFITQRTDKHSTTLRDKQYVPCISLGKLLRLMAVTIVNRSSLVTSDIHGISFGANLVRILDYLGYGNHYWFYNSLVEGATSQSNIDVYCHPFDDKYVNLFRVASYQHVWYDYYRNKYYDLGYTIPSTGLTDEYDYVNIFNFDDLDCSTFANSVLDFRLDNVYSDSTYRVIQMFSQRYCQYKMDVIQSSLPSQQFGAVSSVLMDLSGSVTVQGSVGLNGVTSSDSSRWASVDGSPLNSSQPILSSPVVGARSLIQNVAPDGVTTRGIYHDHSITGTATLQSVASLHNGSAGFDVLSLRRAEVLQNWRQNALRAGNMTDDAMRAHFGVSPQFAMDENVVKLGSFESSLDINPVETTASSSVADTNNRVGDLAATGVSVTSGKTIEFNSRDFGVIMCMAYFRPESEYNSTMIDRANTLSAPFDFFTPEFMNVGLDAVRLSDYSVAENFDMNKNIGFAPQYWWYKTAVDKVHGNFGKFRITNSIFGSGFFTGEFSAWVAPRTIDYGDVSEDGTNIVRSKRSLYVSPDLLDTVFAVEYSPNSDSGFVVNDNLLVNAYFDIKALRSMSVLGLPEF